MTSKKQNGKPGTRQGNKGLAAVDRITKAVERVHQERSGEGFSSGTRQLESAVEAGSRHGGLQIRRVNLSKKTLQDHRVIIGRQNNEYAQAYKVLRTRIWHQIRTNGWQTLAVTSARPGEGKTLTAINLAINLAMMEVGRTVILVDLDMRRPSVHRYLGLQLERSVSDYLVGSAALEEVMMKPDISNNLVLVAGDTPLVNSSEILSSPRMPRLLQELRKNFPSRIVVFDLPPLLPTDDALVIAPLIDAFLLVVGEGISHREDIRKAAELLQDVQMVGSVLNKSEEASAAYGYGY